MPDSNSHRLFLAVPPSPTAIVLLQDFQEQFKKHGGVRPSECKWTPVESLHLTLHFLGASDESKLKLLVERLKVHNWGEKHTMLLDDLVAFPQFNKARVAGVGKTTERTPLHDIHKNVVGILDATGFELEQRDFTPHITLVRFTYSQNCNFLKLHVPSIEYPVNEICLYESILTQHGSKYTILERFKLD